MGLVFSEQQVSNIYSLLNTIQVKGIESMNAVLGIVQILQNPADKKEGDGRCADG